MHLNNNQLSGAIPFIGGLKALTELFLQANGLQGGVTIASLLKLEKVYLNENQLTGIGSIWMRIKPPATKIDAISRSVGGVDARRGDAAMRVHR